MSDSKVLFIVKQIASFILITLGVAVAAITLVLIPSSIIDGCLNSVSIILNKIFGGSLSIYIIILNVSFLIIVWRWLGKKFLEKFTYARLILYKEQES